MIHSSESEIPNEFKVNPIKCDKYLINGELKEWKGNTSDVFSSGMVFYKMITGLLPWSYDINNDDSEKEITRKIFLSRRKKPISPSLIKDGINEKLSKQCFYSYFT